VTYPLCAVVTVQAGSDNSIGTHDKAKSLPADGVRGSPKLKRWKRIHDHDHEDVKDDVLNGVDVPDVSQLGKNESTLKKNDLPNVVISDHTSSSKRYSYV